MDYTGVIVLVILIVVVIAVALIVKKLVGGGGGGGGGGTGGGTGGGEGGSGGGEGGSGGRQSGGGGGVYRPRTLVCPICYKEFKPEEVQFKFSVNGAVVYLAADGTNSATQQFLLKNNYDAQVDRNNGVPTAMRLMKKGTEHKVAQSFYRVCCGERDELSTNAGKYPSENGVFLLGLKSSGKTVYITTAINKLNDVLPRCFGCTLRAYNPDVSTNYMEKYFGVLYGKHELPPATIEASAQLPYEVTNVRTGKIAGVTFSDTKGELAAEGGQAAAAQGLVTAAMYSKFILVTLDIKAMQKDPKQVIKAQEIFQSVIPGVIGSDNEKKYLAIVLTKSDELVGEFDAQAPIYAPVAYDSAGFDAQRRAINETLKKYLMKAYPAIVLAAEHCFGEDQVNYFAVSALGKPPMELKVDEIINPMRVEEPVLWLLKKSGVLNN